MSEQFSTDEIESAFAEFKRRGIGEHDWPGWADLFTDDAVYEEHFLGSFRGREQIKDWIVSCMADYPSMTLWPEWHMVDGNHVAFYIWNNLPDPEGGDGSYQFPNTTLLEYAGDGKWCLEEDYYNPADAERVFGEWIMAGGRRHTPQDRSIEGIEGWAPDPVEPAYSREEVEREFHQYRARANHAVATGDWEQWADQFTEDARYFEHHYGRFNGRDEIKAWITGEMKAFPTMEFPLKQLLIDGNRVVAIVPNVLPAPDGDDGYYGFDVFVILHYAGDGKWSYEEDVYNPREAEAVIKSWLKAGGTIPR